MDVGPNLHCRVRGHGGGSSGVHAEPEDEEGERSAVVEEFGGPESEGHGMNEERGRKVGRSEFGRWKSQHIRLAAAYRREGATHDTQKRRFLLHILFIRRNSIRELRGLSLNDFNSIASLEDYDTTTITTITTTTTRQITTAMAEMNRIISSKKQSRKPALVPNPVLKDATLS